MYSPIQNSALQTCCLIARLPTRPHDEDISVPHYIAEEVYMQPQSKAEAEEIAALNRENSPFLRLSGELRNQIYEYALCQTWRMKPDALFPANNGSKIQNPPFEDLGRVLQTTGACKQMHAEMALLPFRFGTFVIDDCPYAFINQWLLHRSLPQQQAITRIAFPCIYEPSYVARAGWMRGDFTDAGFRPLDATNLKLPIVLPGLRNITIHIDVRSSGERHTESVMAPPPTVARVREWTAYDIEIFKEACLDAVVTVKYQVCPTLYHSPTS